jgi:hypothetical protein
VAIGQRIEELNILISSIFLSGLFWSVIIIAVEKEMIDIKKKPNNYL